MKSTESPETDGTDKPPDIALIAGIVVGVIVIIIIIIVIVVCVLRKSKCLPQINHHYVQNL